MKVRSKLRRKMKVVSEILNMCLMNVNPNVLRVNFDV